MPLVKISPDGTRTEFQEMKPILKPSGSFISASWSELHTYQPKGKKYVDDDFINIFSNRIRGEKCNCKDDFKTWVRINPVKWDDYFAWSVDAHNAVNRRLQKPTLTVDQAKAIWSIDSTT